MIPGISTACLYPEETEKALAMLAEKGVGAAEVFINSISELEPGYLRGLRRAADAAGMRLLAVHPFTSGMEPILFFSGYNRRFQDGRELYRRYYEAAGILGADILVFHGGITQSGVEIDEYCQRFGRLIEDAGRGGMKLCHENVCRCAGRLPEFFREMASRLPEARYVLDVKQAVRAGREVSEYLEAMRGRIEHVHISDHTDRFDCLPPGKGVFNIREFLMSLRSSGFSGGVVVELYRENFGGLVELLDGYQQLCHDISTVS